MTPRYFSDESLIGGASRWPTVLAQALARQMGAWSVELLSYGEPGVELPPEAHLRLLAAHRPRADASPSSALSWELPVALESADVVVVNECLTRSGEIALLTAKALGKPVLAVDHGGWSDLVGSSLGVLELADRVICHSVAAAAALPPGPVPLIVPGGVDHWFFRPAERPTERRHFLFVGRLVPHKGIDRVVGALPPDLPLIVCGRPYDPRYADVLREMATGRRVTFEMEADDTRLRELYRGAWATVMPSVAVDGYGGIEQTPAVAGLSVLESMSCGTPVVASDVGCLPEIVEDGRTGFLCQSVDEVLDRMRLLASDWPLVERLGAEGRLSVGERFSADRVASRISSLVEEVSSSLRGR